MSVRVVAWFLGLWTALCLAAGGALAESAPPGPSASIVVEAGSPGVGRVSPLLFGQFAEFMYEDVKGGLHAELIRDRSFEEAPNRIGLPRYWERDPDTRNDDWALAFGWDEKVHYPPTLDLDMPAQPGRPTGTEHGLRIEIRMADGVRRGIHQDGVPVRAGHDFQGYLWVRSEDFRGHLTVALEEAVTDGARYASADLKVEPGDWRRLTFTLHSSQSDAQARFCILPVGRGRLWIDQVSLMPGDALDGVRADVTARVKALRPAFLRWPGGNVAQDYHWRWGIGPRDRRKTWVNASWSNEPEPSDFGTDEYISFCRAIQAEPSLTVNVDGAGATPAEAAAWVEYCNGPVSSKYGAMRAANGHAEPYRVRMWEVGNEIWGNWVRGHSDAATYARNFNRYAVAMKAVDPSIELIACGDNDLQWNRTVLATCASRMDFLAVHHYYGDAEMKGDLASLMARPLHYERFYHQMRAMIRELGRGRRIRLVINEWNTAMRLPEQHSMLSALYGARLMNVFERCGDLVWMSCVSDLVNGWSGGVIQASRHGVFVTPTYLANEMYARLRGDVLLPVRVEGPTFDTRWEGKGIPSLDVVAMKQTRTGRVTVQIVNTELRQSVRATLRLDGLTGAREARLYVLNGPQSTVANTFSAPDRVKVEERSVPISGGKIELDLPSHAVIGIELLPPPQKNHPPTDFKTAHQRTLKPARNGL